MVMMKREPAVIVNNVSEHDALSAAAAHNAILELARALARMVAREDDATENGV